MKRRYPIILGILLVIFAVWLIITPDPYVRHFMERLDHIGYDIQLRTQLLTHKHKHVSPIAIIDIDDKSLNAEGRWPWSRKKISQLVDQLHKQGAAVIAFDILLSEEESNIAEQVLNKLNKRGKASQQTLQEIKNNLELFHQDTALSKSLESIPSVLAISFLPRKQTQNNLPDPALVMTEAQQRDLDVILANGYISNVPVIQKASAGSGFINIFPDSDGIIRHAPLVMAYKSGVYPALSVQAIMSFLNEKLELITHSYGEESELEGIKIGHIKVPVNIRGEALIPFIGKSFTFPYYSATDVLNNNIPANALVGKILFIGTSATGLGDLKATAIQNPYPGVEVQATLANGMLQQIFSHIPAWTYGANIILTIFLGMIAAFLFPYLGPRTLGVIIVFLPALILFINNWIWAETGLLLSVVVPAVLVTLMAGLNILYGYLFESRKREHLKEMFGQYVPEKHIDEMLKTTDNYAMRGEDREMSVLFADIRSFTTISEDMSAEELVDMLNTFFTPMTKIIFDNRGTIDKYVGDLIMAFWGAPLDDKHHAAHAIQSALEMQLKLKAMQPLLKEKNWPVIQVGIGINSGHMSVGDMGSKYRRNYTVLGDAVNLASRVEGLTKFYGVDIIVTENTVKEQETFILRKLDKVAVKGKSKGVIIYEVIGKKASLDNDLKMELNKYHQAVEAYFNQQWDSALDKMIELHQSYPDVKIYSLYVDRINQMMKAPPSKDWDGVFIHKSK